MLPDTWELLQMAVIGLQARVGWCLGLQGSRLHWVCSVTVGSLDSHHGQWDAIQRRHAGDMAICFCLMCCSCPERNGFFPLALVLCTRCDLAPVPWLYE